MSDNQKGLLTPEELEKLVMALGAGQDTFTKEEVIQVAQWANRVKCDNLLLQGVLLGHLMIGVTEGGDIGFKLTEQGREKARGTYGPVA